MLVSFTDRNRKAGIPSVGFGMFAAVSYDDGGTWPVKRLVGGLSGGIDGGGHTGVYPPDVAHVEPPGYLAATQTSDGTIHLLSSRYRFSLAWLKDGDK